MSSPVILGLMTFCFLFFGYLGVPVPFSLMAGVFVGVLYADIDGIFGRFHESDRDLLAMPGVPIEGVAAECPCGTADAIAIVGENRRAHSICWPSVALSTSSRVPAATRNSRARRG